MHFAITGISLCLPGMNGNGNWRSALSATEPNAELIRGLHGDLLSDVRGCVASREATETFSVRQRKQCDISTLLGMSSLDSVFLEAVVPMGLEVERLGLFCSTTLGGVDFSEEQLFYQACQRPDRVSAFQAIAWFYAATQGQWTISRGITGYAKSFAADRAGAIQCLIDAMIAIQVGHCDVALCAAFDAPLSPFSLALHHSGCRFSAETKMVFSEAAGAFCIEPLEHATMRGANIFGIIIAADARAIVGTTSDAAESTLSSIAKCAENEGGVIGHILIEGGQESLAQELETIIRRLNRSESACISAPNRHFGTMLAAGVFLDIAYGCCLLRNTPASVVKEPTLTSTRGEEGSGLQRIGDSARKYFVVASGATTGVFGAVAVF